MKFSHFYTKFEWKRFSTIRRYKKYNEGDKIPIYVRTDFQGKAIINKIYEKTFDTILEKTLIEDMLPFAHNREECFNFLQGFYRKPINREKDSLYIYYLEWI